MNQPVGFSPFEGGVLPLGLSGPTEPRRESKSSGSPSLGRGPRVDTALR